MLPDGQIVLIKKYFYGKLHCIQTYTYPSTNSCLKIQKNASLKDGKCITKPPLEAYLIRAVYYTVLFPYNSIHAI